MRKEPAARTEPPNLSKLGFSLKEAGELSGLGQTSLFQAMKEKRLLGRKYGRRTIILRDDLVAFLQSLDHAR